MKILVISNLYPPEWLGGYELGCSQMVEHLRALGHQVLVATSSQNYASTNPFVRDANDMDVRRLFYLHDIYRASLRGGIDTKLNVRARLYCHHNISVLVSLLADFDPDVVYMFNTLGLGCAGILSTIEQQGYPWVWHLMDIIPRQMVEINPLLPLAPCRVVDDRPSLNGEFVACSKGLFREIEQLGLSLTGRTHVIPNWIDVPLRFERDSYYTPGRKLRVCFSGSIGPSKGVDHLVEGLKLAAESRRLDDILEVHLFGQGDTLYYEERCMAAGLSNVIKFRGPVARSALIDLFYDYDLMLFPTWAREPFAFAPMEAASRGCVQAFSDDCGNAEWFFHGIDCLKFRRSPEGVANLIADVLRGKYSFEELAENQASSLRMHFSLEVVRKSVESVLTAAASRRKAPVRSAEWSRQFGILAENIAINLGAT